MWSDSEAGHGNDGGFGRSSVTGSRGGLAGASRRQAAERFKVSAASAVRWAQLHGRTGGVDPRPRGGKSRSPLEATFGLAAGFGHRGTGPDAGSDRAEALGRSWAEDFGGRGSSLLQAARDHLQKKRCTP